MAEECREGHDQVAASACFRNHAHVRFVRSNVAGFATRCRRGKGIVKRPGLTPLIIVACSNSGAFSLVNLGAVG